MEKSCRIHVVIADDHSIVREGLSAVIHREPDMELVAEARTWPEAVDKVLQTLPEIAVLDLHMRGMEPAEGIATIRAKCPASRDYCIFGIQHGRGSLRGILAGARGYVLKGESGREDLLQCIHAVSRGETWVHPLAAGRLAARATAPELDAAGD